MSNNKTGHIINANNFDKIIVICKSYDLIYKPSKLTLGIDSLETIAADVKSILAELSLKEIAYSKDTNDRELLYVDLKRFSTRVLLAAKSSGVTSAHYNDLVNINRKIQGRRAVAITEEEKALLAEQDLLKAKNMPSDPNAKKLKKNSVSQLSYDRLYSNFSKLIEVLKSTPSYQPNEVDLKIVTLEAKLTLMNLSNQIVSTSLTNLNKARFDRNNLMYLQENNLVDIAYAVKNYTKSVFGARSIQNKQLSAIKFSKLKK